MTHPSSLPDDELARLARRAVDALPDAPADSIQRAIALWPAPTPQQPSPLREAVASGWRLVQAVLRYDSAVASPLALGLRGGAAGGPTRHLLFSAEGRDIDLRVTASRDRFAIMGQVLGPDEAGRIELHDDDGHRAGAELDELGGFVLDDLPPGRYRMSLRAGGDEVALPPIELGDTRAPPA